MKVHPALQALRDDDAPQRRAQGQLYRELEAWRAGVDMAGIEAELAELACAVPLESLPRLSALFTPADPSAQALAGGFAARFCAALGRDPLGQVPLRHQMDDVTTALMLARTGNAALLLCAVDGAALARRGLPVSASFPPSQTWERVLAGSVRITRISLCEQGSGRADFLQAEERLDPGMVSHRVGQREALVLREVEGSLVTLKLQLQAKAGAVTREYRLADGALLHQAAANPRDSRLELAAALLGRMGRRDAAPLLAAMAGEAGGASLRWQALKECLGLDTATGFDALCTIAARGDDPLAAPADALRARLIESYPVLAGIAPCPA